MHISALFDRLEKVRLESPEKRQEIYEDELFKYQEECLAIFDEQQSCSIMPRIRTDPELLAVTMVESGAPNSEFANSSTPTVNNVEPAAVLVTPSYDVGDALCKSVPSEDDFPLIDIFADETNQSQSSIGVSSSEFYCENMQPLFSTGLVGDIFDTFDLEKCVTELGRLENAFTPDFADCEFDEHQSFRSVYGCNEDFNDNNALLENFMLEKLGNDERDSRMIEPSAKNEQLETKLQHDNHLVLQNKTTEEVTNEQTKEKQEETENPVKQAAVELENAIFIDFESLSRNPDDYDYSYTADGGRKPSKLLEFLSAFYGESRRTSEESSDGLKCIPRTVVCAKLEQSYSGNVLSRSRKAKYAISVEPTRLVVSKLRKPALLSRLRNSLSQKTKTQFEDTKYQFEPWIAIPIGECMVRPMVGGVEIISRQQPICFGYRQFKMDQKPKARSAFNNLAR